MTRKEEINRATREYVNTCPFEYSPNDISFQDSARWADSHPKNPWHKVADGDLPEDGQHILYAKKIYYGFFYNTIYYPEPPITDGIDYWMEIPEININSEKVSTNYDAEYLQSKIDAHTKRMEEQGLTSERMLEECRGDYSLTWQDIRRIVKIADDFINYTEPTTTEKEYYEQVLKAFLNENS